MTTKTIRFGTDSSARPILMTPYMATWWDEFAELCATKGPGGGFEPTVVQGGFMSTIAGGGAKASAGYHDLAGCLDIRVWDRTEEQVAFMVRRGRGRAAAMFLRNAQHGGMDPHIHLILGPDVPKASGAAWQWQEYLAGRDGLASRGKDYHWRPDPIVTSWSPAPKPTVNINAYLAAKTTEERKRSLNKIIRHSKNPAAVRSAKAVLAGIKAKEAATQKIRVARGDLRDLAVK